MNSYELPKVEGGLERSIEDLERACLVLIKDEQEKINPDNALIAVLCDSVRMGREYCGYLQRIGTK